MRVVICSTTVGIITSSGRAVYAAVIKREYPTPGLNKLLTHMASSKPAPGDEYKIMMCRSTSATGGFVDQSGKSCTSNGGTILLGSHGTTYGPGGQ